MPGRRRWVFLICIMGTFATPARAGEPENWERLRAMPRERRVALAENMKQFDALSHAERTAIREMDERIAQLPPAEQVHYRDLLRRYHLWVQGLTEAQRELVRYGKSDKERMAAVSKLRKARPGTLAKRGATPLSVQLAPVAFIPSVELGRAIRNWLELPPAKRANAEKLAPIQFMNQMGALKPDSGPSPMEISEADENVLIKELEAELTRARQAPIVMKYQLEKAGKNDSEKVAAKQARRNRLQVIENYYFVKHPPQKVDAENLLRFSRAVPNWVRAALTALPADEARRRLAILYRLAYPHPGEMPSPKAPEKPAPAKKDATGKPAAKGAGKPAAKPAAPPPSSAGTPL
jgi:hypothetical protein